MAYCVNCGVKLKTGVKKCPLCDTPVILQASEPESESCDGFPKQREEPEAEFDKDLWVKLISVVTATPALLSLVIDYLAGFNISWSLYVIYSMGLVWVWCVSPFIFKRNIFTLWLGIDTAALIGFLFLVEYTSGTGSWVLPLALPIVLSVSIIIYILITAFRTEMVHQLQKPALAFFGAAFLSLVVEVVVDFYRNGRYQPGWSVLVAIPTIAFGVILLILQRRQWIVEELRHWFRV